MNPIPRNIYQRIVDKLQRAEKFSVKLEADNGKIEKATWTEEQQPEQQPAN